MGDSKNSIAMNNRQPKEMQEKNESNDFFPAPRQRSCRLLEGVIRQVAVAPIAVAGIAKKGLEQRQALGAPYTGADADTTVPVKRSQTGTVAGGAAAHGVFVAIDNLGDAVQHKGAETHQAGLHGAEHGDGRWVQRLPGRSQFAQRYDFGMIQLVACAAAGALT